MGRVVIKNVIETEPQSFPELGNVQMTGGVLSRPVIHGPDRPLSAWQHTLNKDQEIHWQKPSMGHVIYVMSGSIDVSGSSIDKDGVLIVEHGGETSLRARVDGTTLLHFHQASGTPARAGGHTHICAKSNAAYYHHPHADGFVYADSSCPTCELWMHKNEFKPGETVGRHSHTEDEIIFVVNGTMKVGRRNLPQGTALAIDADTVYTFTAGGDGLEFVNFRPFEPSYVMVTPEGKAPPRNERLSTARMVAETAEHGHVNLTERH